LKVHTKSNTITDVTLDSSTRPTYRRARDCQRAAETDTNGLYLKPLKRGDKVRLDNLELDHQQQGMKKSGTFKSSHHEVWSRAVFTVQNVYPASKSVSLEEDVEVNKGDTKLSGYKFPRGRVQLIEP
jgi:hypothetical protein